MKRKIGLILVSLLLSLILCACSAEQISEAVKEKMPDSVTPEMISRAEDVLKLALAETSGQEVAVHDWLKAAGVNYPDLTGETLMVYCGAGMKQPFQVIADTFEALSGCSMQVTYANAAQIQTQISTAQEGAFFIAGAAGEVKPVADFVISQKNLVKHIPVLAVAAGNPKGITGIADLANPDIATVIGDAESTPIGKIAMQAFSDFGVADKVNLIATTTTAPQLATVISLGEADAAIIWKENCNVAGVEICETPDMNAYVKVVPAARLTFSEGDTAADVFESFLDTDAAKGIWEYFGYELAA